MILTASFAVGAPIAADAIVLRALTVADAEPAAQVIRAAFAAQPRPTDPPSSALGETAGTVATKIATGGGFGAFADRRLVAVALWRAEDGALFVGRVSALPEGRGKGLARRLIAACELTAGARGIGRLRLRARLELPENERLFTRLGFSRVGVEAHPGFDEPTVAVMEKRLS